MDDLWIEYGKDWNTFCADNLSISGTLIEVIASSFGAEPELMLIGNINQRGGACECCGIGNPRVIRYKRVAERYKPISGSVT